MISKFNIGEEVIADGDPAFVTQIIPAPDSEWNKTSTYAVEWQNTHEWASHSVNSLTERLDEWGVFTEQELKKVI